MRIHDITKENCPMERLKRLGPDVKRNRERGLKKEGTHKK